MPTARRFLGQRFALIGGNHNCRDDAAEIAANFGDHFQADLSVLKMIVGENDVRRIAV